MEESQIQQDRRADATRIAILEERSKASKEQLDRIENLITRQINDHTLEVDMIKMSITKMTTDFHYLNSQIDERIKVANTPLIEKVSCIDLEVQKYKSSTKTLISVGTGLFAIITLFKEPILNLLTK